jgi:2-oxoisovalerate dehydrogenase E1 component
LTLRRIYDVIGLITYKPSFTIIKLSQKLIMIRESNTELSNQQLLALYRQMLEIRRCEEQLTKAYQAGLILGACHTYIGQEAIATGVCAHLRKDDAVFSTHRGHGHALTKGVSPREVMAELLGRATGCSRGRGGSMHLFSPEVGMMGTSGIVSPCILQATGAGYSFKLLKTDRVGVAFFGDGASNNGAFHEGLNMASIWKLPVLFVCENNLYATEISLAYAAGNPNIVERAASYGLPGIAVDGNDVMAVYEVSGEAISRARRGDGATLIECKTYRTRPHSEGMRDTGYRTKEEIESWKLRDPIESFRKRLLMDGTATDEDFKRIETEINAVIEDALEFAKNSPWPDPATVLDHVYSTAVS